MKGTKHMFRVITGKGTIREKGVALMVYQEVQEDACLFETREEINDFIEELKWARDKVFPNKEVNNDGKNTPCNNT